MLITNHLHFSRDHYSLNSLSTYMASFRRVLADSRRGLFFLPISLAFASSVFLFLYVSSTSKLYIHPGLTRVHVNPHLEFSKFSSPPHPQESVRTVLPQQSKDHSPTSQEPVEVFKNIVLKDIGFKDHGEVSLDLESPLRSETVELSSIGKKFSGFSCSD